VAGHVGLELRNVDANYPFERSHRFAGIQPNSGFGDYSRLSCGVALLSVLRLRVRPLLHGYPAYYSYGYPPYGYGDRPYYGYYAARY
jgi:hypothetical protein